MILTDDALISEAGALIDSVVDRAVRLPEQVFRVDFSQFCWLEFEDILGPSFFSCLQALCTEYRDRAFYAACLDPGVIEDYGHSGVASFACTDSPASYAAYLDAEFVSPTINLRNVSTRIAFVGDKRCWAFVADRGVELAVGAQMRPDHWPVLKDLRYHTFDTMLELASGPFRKQLPPELQGAYERNYRARSWNISKFVEG